MSENKRLNEDRFGLVLEICEYHQDRGWVTKDPDEIHLMTTALIDLPPMIAEIRRLRAENEGLRPLAKLGAEALDASNGGSDFDGADVYEMAIKVGAVVQVPFDPEKHEDVWGVGMEPGDTWGEIVPNVLAAKRMVQA